MNQLIIEVVARTSNMMFMRVKISVLERKVFNIPEKCPKSQDNIKHIKNLFVLVLLFSSHTFHLFSSMQRQKNIENVKKKCCTQFWARYVLTF